MNIGPRVYVDSTLQIPKASSAYIAIKESCASSKRKAKQNPPRKKRGTIHDFTIL